MTLILKYSEVRKQNRYAVTTLNYIMASLVLIFTITLSSAPLPPVHPGQFFQEFYPVVMCNQGMFSPGAAMVWILLVGVAGGGCFCAGLIFIQKSIEENGVSITGAFSKLGIVLPLCFALFLWKEVPNLLTSYFLITAFKTMKTTLVFPLFSSGVIFMVTLGGLTLFREHLEKRKITAIGMILVAVILMNTH
jgi:multidrug transporter EmrE-like cation transporter